MYPIKRPNNSKFQNAKLKLNQFTNPLNLPIIYIRKEFVRGVSSPGWTDGSAIYIYEPILEKMVDELTIVDLHTFVQTIIFHETGHALLTDFQVYESFMELIISYYPYIFDLIKDLSNILEDERVEFYLSVLYPGLVDKFRTSSIILSRLKIKEEKGVMGALFSINELVFAIVRMKHLNGSIHEYIDTYFPAQKKFLKRLFDAKGLKVLVEAIHSNNTRGTLIRTLYFYKRALEILNEMYGTTVVKDEIMNYAKTNFKFIFLLLRQNTPIGRIAPYLSDDILSEIYELYEKGLGDWMHISELLEKRGVLKYHNIGKGGFTQIVEFKDYTFYMNSVNENIQLIIELRKAFEKLKMDWEASKADWGDPLEEHMLEAYEWSLTRDIPRPQIFEGYRKVMPEIDILILLDQSGSMQGEAGTLVMKSTIIVSEALKPLLGERVRLGIYTYGSNIRKVKGFTEPIFAGRYFPRPEGGTSTFESLAYVVENEKDNFNKNSTKIFLVFTDSMNYDNDRAEEVMKEIIDLIGINIRTFAIVTSKSYDPDFVEHFDSAYVITHINEFVNIMLAILYEQINSLSLRAKI